MNEMPDIRVRMTMLHDDDELIIHHLDGGHHVKSTEIMMDDPEIVLDEPTSATILNRNSERTYSFALWPLV